MIAVEHLKRGIAEGHDLAEKSVHPHEPGQLVAKLTPSLLVRETVETIHRGLEVSLHLGMVLRRLLVWRTVEHRAEGFHFVPVVDLCLIKVVLQLLQLVGIGFLLEAGLNARKTGAGGFTCIEKRPRFTSQCSGTSPSHSTPLGL